MVAACSVKSNDETPSTGGTPDAGIENPFAGGGDDAGDTSGNGGDAGDAGDSGTGGSTGGASSGGSSSGGGQSTHTSTEPLVIKTDALKDGLQGEVYNQKLTAEGGSGQYEWSAVKGLPANGLELKTRWIKGVPASAGTLSITIKVKDEETGETVSKDFELKVIKHLDEALRIVVEQSDGTGGWSAVDATKDTVEFDNAARRIRLTVMKSDGSVPSAERYHWSVLSPEQRLAAFVPPEPIAVGGVPAAGPQARKAYLIAWEKKGTGSLALFDILSRKIDLSKTRISVQDDYGNKAAVTFDTIVIAGKAGASSASSSGKDLRIKAPEEVRKVPGQSQPGDPKSLWDFAVTIENGTPPYTLEVQKTKACQDLPASQREYFNYDLNTCVTDGHDWYWNCDASACWHFELEAKRDTSDGRSYTVKQAMGKNGDGISRNRMLQKGSSCAHVSSVDLIARDADGKEATKTVALVINFHPTDDLEYCEP
jgi:hypothetical protein